MEHNPRLTSSEIASLWSQYNFGTMSLCVNRYMYKILHDSQIKSVFEYAIELGEKHKETVERFFGQENIPIPLGFNEGDVNLNAPRLFSDEFCLFYLHEMAIHGLSGYGVALPVSTRKDIREYFVECNVEGMEVYNRTIEIMLEKGIYQRPPYISTPDGPDPVDDKNFISGMFGERRPLNVIEISDIYFNLKKSLMSKAIGIGFDQITERKEVKIFIHESLEVANKHIQELTTKLHESNLPNPFSYEDHITDSKTSPFSERLIMYHAGFLFQSAIAYYGAAMAVSMRSDLIAQYIKTISEDFKYAGKWIDIMIKNKWLEQPPQANNRRELRKN